MAENEEEDLDLSAGMVPHGVSALPAPVRRVLSSTGLQVKPAGAHVGAQNLPAIASVDAGSPNTINVEDPGKFSAGGPQTLGHESVHLWHNNLPPAIQAQIPPDDPKDPYNYGGAQGLQQMRDQGMKLWNLPREKAATVVQYYISQGGDKAPQQVKDAYGPWVKDMNSAPLSSIVPSEPDQAGMNTTARPPQAPASMYETKIFAKGDPAPGEMPTHPAGQVTGFDEQTGLPIVKRKSSDTGKPAASPEPEKPLNKQVTENKEDGPVNGGKPGLDLNKPAEKSSPAKSETKTPLAKGDSVQLPDGTKGRIAHVVDTRTVRVKTDDGRNLTVRQSALQAMDHVVVKQHIRRIPR